MKIGDLLEARKNQHLNVREDTITLLDNWYKKDPNLFVTFTKIDKVGTNPQTRFNTPMGIYTYPLSYVVNLRGDVPWMGTDDQAQWIYVLKVDDSANIITLKNSHVQGNPYFRQVVIAGLKKYGYEVNPRDEAAERYSDMDTWYIMYNAIKQQLIHSNFALIAYKILNSGKIDGVIDPGFGIVHMNEPTQALFFNKRALHVVDKIPNKLRYQQYHRQARIDLYNQSKQSILNRLYLATDTYTRNERLEQLIMKTKTAANSSFDEIRQMISYISDCTTLRQWPFLEGILVAKKDPYLMFVYARDVLQHRWPEAEPIIQRDVGVWNDYRYYFRNSTI